MVVGAVAVAVICAVFGGKRRLHILYGRAEPDEHGADDVIAPDEQTVVLELRGQVPVADMPGEADEMGPIAAGDFIERLARGLDADAAAIAQMQRIAIGQRYGRGEIDKDVLARRQAESLAAKTPFVCCERYGHGRAGVDLGGGNMGGYGKQGKPQNRK